MSLYFPAFLDVRGRACLVVGGGRVARRKAESLVRAGARVHVVAAADRADAEELKRLASGRPAVTVHGRAYKPCDLDGKCLVIAATDDAGLNAAVARDARQKRVLVNVVDAPDLGDFIAPAVARRGDLLIAVSTGGASPSLARGIRMDLERTYPEAYGEYVEFLGALRNEVLAHVADAALRRWVLRRFAEPDIAALFVRPGPGR